MRAVDTNVLARWVLGDDPEQTPLALDVINEPVWISATVLLELGWVLAKARGLPRETVAAMLKRVLRLETAAIDRRAQFLWAVDRYQAGADWADLVHLAATGTDAESFATFDRALRRKAGHGSPIPIEIIR